MTTTDMSMESFAVVDPPPVTLELTGWEAVALGYALEDYNARNLSSTHTREILAKLRAARCCTGSGRLQPGSIGPGRLPF